MPHIGIIQYLSLCDWFISLCIMPSRFIPLLECIRFFSILRLNNLLWSAPHFLYPSINKHLGCFYFWVVAIVNNAAITINVQIFPWDAAEFFEYILEWDCQIIWQFYFTFRGTSILFFIAAKWYIATVLLSSKISTLSTLVTFWFFYLFSSSHLNQCVVSLGLGLNFSNY